MTALQQLHDPAFRGFASDNYSGIHPEVLEAIALANGGHQKAYGDDVYTAALGATIKEVFGEAAEVYPVFNGTGANVVSLDLLTDRWGAVVCARSAHINVDECGAPEKIAGIKLLPVDTPNGKLTPELIDTVAWGFGDEHHAQPAVVSVTQSTELGTLYSLDELRDVASILDRGASYQRQQAVAEEHGGSLKAVVAHLVKELRDGVRD